MTRLASKGRPFEIYVDGIFSSAQDTYEITNPADESVVAEAPDAGVAEAEQAIAAARSAFDAWSRTSPEERSRLLAAVAQQIVERQDDLWPLLQAETGSTALFSQFVQVPPAAMRFNRYAQLALESTTVPIEPAAMVGMTSAIAVRQPVGVVACITPYNAPLVNLAGKLGPALAMGNTVVCKPAPADPLGVLELARIVDEVGFPPGVVNVITSAGPDTGEALVASKDVDMVSFTGSDAVGVKIAQAGGQTMKRLLLELGGKSACIVFADADLDRAVATAAEVWTRHSGQMCIAPSRLLVERPVYDEVVAKMKVVAEGLKVGDPLEADTVVGPLISARQRELVEGHIAAGRDDGAELIAGGKRPAHLERGYYIEPTLFAEGHNQMRLARQEVFGPVTLAIPFDDEDEAIALANDCDYGLYGYVHAGDVARAVRVARRLRTGSVLLNGSMPNLESPFGGFKMSGVGRDGGRWALSTYSELQSIAWTA